MATSVATLVFALKIQGVFYVKPQVEASFLMELQMFVGLQVSPIFYLGLYLTDDGLEFRNTSISR